MQLYALFSFAFLALLIQVGGATWIDPKTLDACPGYNTEKVIDHGHSLSADLVLAGKACSVFGGDIERLKLEVTYETSESDVHTKLDCTSLHRLVFVCPAFELKPSYRVQLRSSCHEWLSGAGSAASLPSRREFISASHVIAHSTNLNAENQCHFSCLSLKCSAIADDLNGVPVTSPQFDSSVILLPQEIAFTSRSPTPQSNGTKFQRPFSRAHYQPVRAYPVHSVRTFASITRPRPLHSLFTVHRHMKFSSPPRRTLSSLSRSTCA